MFKDIIRKAQYEVTIDIVEDEYEGNYEDGVAIDEFGRFDLVVQCAAEDAIWDRALSRNYWTGFELGAKNSIKVLVENPELYEQAKKELKEITNE